MEIFSLSFIILQSFLFPSLPDTGNVQPTPAQPTTTISIDSTTTVISLVPIDNDELDVDIDRLIAFKNTFKIDPRK